MWWWVSSKGWIVAAEYSIHMHGDVRGHANEAKGTFKRDHRVGTYNVLWPQSVQSHICTTLHQIVSRLCLERDTYSKETDQCWSGRISTLEFYHHSKSYIEGFLLLLLHFLGIQVRYGVWECFYFFCFRYPLLVLPSLCNCCQRVTMSYLAQFGF